MNSKRTKTALNTDLRRQAEKLLKNRKSLWPAGDTEDTQRLIYELQVHQIELELQNEDLMEAHHELEKNHEKYIDLYDFAPVGYFTFDKKGTILEVNLTGAEIAGIERGALIKRDFSRFIHREDRDTFYLHQIKVFETGSPESCELRITRKDSSSLWARLRSIAVNDTDQQTRHCRTAVIDITDQKQAEEQIRRSLSEKELLLQEVHHRVKNNMMVIQSLLELQAKKSGDEKYKTMIKESVSRIKSMALIHEKLYGSDDMANVRFDDYLEGLLNYIFMSYGIGTHKVALKKDVGMISLGINTAIPCAMIVNELISNCLKHAFPDDREGEITIILRKAGALHATKSDQQSSIELIVSDNGVGIHEIQDFKKNDSLGLHMVHTLVKQINGSIELQGGEGTDVKIRFNG